ncbi:hypothetical protein SAMN05216215_100698 [Saccharopolyspora shandongensis]|uniref:Uncharacterized protein n=1 Tax=Saccharopolyspora shandongensis TaxID=418495 RepID=A0A1H2XIP2_9PSEU|nr:hypothetical protein [Saccharopolyspora shandongensis]SDW92646.1 hypothetical protein SAMN05216215_100698 [Saccharopolyspora shandongensis]
MPSPGVVVMGSIPTWPDTQIVSPTRGAREKVPTDRSAVAPPVETRLSRMIPEG